jgi:putative ABC transport system permease protein
LPASVSKVIRISPLRTDTVRISTRTGEQDLDLAAVWPAIQDISGLQIKNGRFLAPIDQGNLVAVLGSTAADKLAAAGRPISLGSTIPLGRYLFTIVGIMQEAPENHFTPIDFNKAIIIPLGVSDRVLGHAAPNSAMGLMMAGSDPASVSAAIVAVFARANPDGPVRVQGARELIQALRAQRAIQNRMFVALAGVSLLVGGIGVMNVMFMSVMERRREIGLRAAVGASPRVIQLAFLIEAGILSGLGGFGGSLIGVILSIAVALHSGWTFQVPLYAVPIGVGLAIVAGMIFGVVPALKASRLNPMEALRAE